MAALLSFFIILVAGLFFSSLFSKFHVPWVVALVLGGILIGPAVFDIVVLDPTIEFIGEIGLVFLMFMAGLESSLGRARNLTKQISIISLFNSMIPLGAGYLLGYLFGYEPMASLFIGVIFMSSSIAVVIPSLQSSKLLKTNLGKTILGSTMAEDILSLVVLSVLLQIVHPTSNLPLPLYFGLLLAVMLILRFIILQFERVYSKREQDKDAFENHIRLTFAILIGTVVIFELVGLHSIVAGFFAGFVISGTIHGMHGELLIEKLRAISYGVFIPTFFIVIGVKTDISVFSQAGPALTLAVSIIVTSMAAKYLSGWAGARISGYGKRESALVGASTIPQLSTTLAVAFTGLEFGVLDQNLVTSMVTLSIITTLVSPILIQLISRKLDVNRLKEPTNKRLWRDRKIGNRHLHKQRHRS